MNKLVPYYSNYCELSTCCCSALLTILVQTFKQSCHKKRLITEKFQFFSFNGSSSFGQKRHRNFYTVISSTQKIHAISESHFLVFTLEKLLKIRKTVNLYKIRKSCFRIVDKN